MIFNTEKIQDVFVVRLQGSLDVAVQTALKEKLQEFAEKNDDDIVLDFTSVHFIDSSCLGALVALLKRIRERKGDIKIAHLSDDVRSIFQITRLDRVFEIFDTTDEAVTSFYR